MGNSTLSRNVTLTAVAVTALLVGGLAGSGLTARVTAPPFEAAQVVPVRVAEARTDQPDNQVSFLNGYTPVVKRALPAVVSIASTKVIRIRDTAPDFFGPFFDGNSRNPFGTPRSERLRGLGSGVIVNPDGYILTNNHVVDGATDIKISLSDKREFTARIVGRDPKSDIAVLKVDATGLLTLPIGDSSKVEAGQFALAVGNPFGVGQTVTMGIISATGRGGGLGIEDYEDFIQTDAAINPGNSGGALINVRGELIGINTAILSGGGGNQGVGFAVPANMARGIMEQLLKQGKVVRGWLGVTVQPVTPELAKAFKLSGQGRGALVGDVGTGSPAATAGLVRGDIILELDGEPIADSRALSLKTAALVPGATVRLKAFRDGRERDLSVTLAAQPSDGEERREDSPDAEDRGRLGLNIEPLVPQVARQLGLPQETGGLLIRDVQPGSLAEAAGLKPGDIIQEVDRKAAGTVEALRQAVSQAGNQTLLLTILRERSHLFVALDLSDRGKR